MTQVKISVEPTTKPATKPRIEAQKSDGKKVPPRPTFKESFAAAMALAKGKEDERNRVKRQAMEARNLPRKHNFHLGGHGLARLFVYFILAYGFFFVLRSSGFTRYIVGQYGCCRPNEIIVADVGTVNMTIDTFSKNGQKWTHTGSCVEDIGVNRLDSFVDHPFGARAAILDSTCLTKKVLGSPNGATNPMIIYSSTPEMIALLSEQPLVVDQIVSNVTAAVGSLRKVYHLDESELVELIILDCPINAEQYYAKLSKAVKSSGFFFNCQTYYIIVYVVMYSLAILASIIISKKIEFKNKRIVSCQKCEFPQIV